MIQMSPQNWTGPISNIIIVLGGIWILFPILKRLSLEQLTASLNAIDIAKKFPDAISKLNDFSKEMDKVESSFSKLEDRLKVLTDMDARLEGISRRVEDLQKAQEAASPVEAPLAKEDTTYGSDSENWEAISSGWSKIKEYIETRISEILDQRVANKYNALSRFDYGPVGEKLVADQKLTTLQARALKNAHDLFRSIKNRRTRITPELRKEFEQYSREIFSTGTLR